VTGMPQDSLSSLTQSVGNAGYLVLQRIDITGASPTVSVSFVPTLAKMVHPQHSPLQYINVAVGGSIHTYQYSTNEPLTWTVIFQDLPFFDNDILQPVVTQGFQALQSFIRYTLNYCANPCIMTTPDGYIETMRYINGLETFAEAEGQTQKVQRWSGQLVFSRDLSS
jgi:hypothetical protein